MAVVLKNPEIVKLLLLNGADSTIQDVSGETVLHEALKNTGNVKDMEIIYLLAETKDVLNVPDFGRGYTPFHLAFMHGDAQMIEKFIQLGADTSVKAKADFFRLCEIEAYKEINKLLNKEPHWVLEKDFLGYTALHNAVLRNDIVLTKILLEKGADCKAEDEDGKTPLFMAFGASSKEIVELLIAAGANVNHSSLDGMTPLFIVTSMDTAEVLIAAGANVNHLNDFDRTPIFYANFEVAKSLVKAGANLNQLDWRNQTPLFNLEYPDYELVEFLVTSGVDINHKNCYNETALQKMVQYENDFSIIALLKLGANPADLFKPVFVCDSSKQVDFNYYEKGITDILLKAGYSNDDIQAIFRKYPFENPFI